AGHLGAPDTKQVNNEETKLENSIPETKAVLQELGLDIPIIAAGGATDRADFDRILTLGASGVQMGTRFLATHESGASPEFKESVIRAQEEDIITYTSNAMLPARGLGGSGIFKVIEHRMTHVRKCIENCLSHCAYRDGIEVLPSGETPDQMCILRALVAATEGNPPEADETSLKFVGTSAVRIKTLKSVEEIMNEIAYPKT
ncbi:MAG: nitronate monooxygenase, partial [Candidatus Gracilibacteria bacterium]|nr:nitronate monooxygenase [Candidatus Gracilibacteria bacterium]